MNPVLERWSDGALSRVGTIAADPSLQPEFELLLGHGLAAMMNDAYNRPEFRRIAVLDGEDVGFSYAFVLPTAGAPFAVLRVAVTGRARRLGVGSALLAGLIAQVKEEVPTVGECVMGAITPSPPAQGFAARHGFAPARKHWLMDRPGRTVPPPQWPEGLEIRRFDGSDRALEQWVDVFNRSWKEQDHAVLATADDMRRQLAGGTMDPAGMLLAVRGQEPVGFVRGTLHPTRGEISVLGVVPECRGAGLGRALLRLGCLDLLERGASQVTLTVDGQNDRAIALYTQESFVVLRTRQIWSRRH